VTEEQRKAWRKAVASHNRQQRQQRGRRKRGVATVSGAGMVRVPAPRDSGAQTSARNRRAPAKKEGRA